MNTLCLVVSRMSFFVALTSFVALCMTGSGYALFGLIWFSTLSVIFQIAYNNYRGTLRERAMEELADNYAATGSVEGLADLLEPEEDE